MAAGEAHINFSVWQTCDAACAALDALRGARVVAIRFSEVDGIPASALSHHPSLRRLYFSNCAMPPLCDLAGHTQLHGLRELFCRSEDEGLVPESCYQLQHVQPLSQLEVLDIEGIQKTEGADATLAALPRLRELNLSESDLHTVPASMASLTRLTRLDLACTQVTDGWQHLPLQLQHLNLRNIELTTVPPELSRLSRLTELDLACNEELEGGSLQVLGRLSSLQQLSLSLSSLGDADLDDLALPTTLDSLVLSSNELTAVPLALAPLTGLTMLYLGCNQLVGGWHHLAGMQQLAHLWVAGCSLKTVPQVLLKLTALTSLDVGYNSIASGWQHLAALRQLASLRVAHCSLAAVPHVFSHLTTLTSLNMGGNPVSSGWQHHAGMQQLESLDLYGCSLTAVPEDLSQLTALTRLQMRENPIASGWEHLSLLPLRELQTNDPVHRIPSP